MRWLKKSVVSVVAGAFMLLATPTWADASLLAIHITNVEATHTTWQKIMDVIQEASKKEAIAYLVMPIGHVQAQRINAYLQTGDKEALETIMKQMYAPYYIEEMAAFLEDLYAYNAMASQPIEMIGTGADRKEDVVTYLQMLLEPYKKDAVISEYFAFLYRYPSVEIAAQLQDEWLLDATRYKAIVTDEVYEKVACLLDSLWLNRPYQYVENRVQERAEAYMGDAPRIYIDAVEIPETISIYELPIV